jgi:hypothetical protein
MSGLDFLQDQIGSQCGFLSEGRVKSRRYRLLDLRSAKSLGGL